MNTPVSFELAKLLKEKCFDKRTPMVWLFSLGKQHLRELHLSLELNDCEYNAPTIADVVMWLYENHGIWISVIMTYPETFEYSIVKLDSTKELAIIHQQLKSPIEAYEAGINYCLTKLI